MSRLVALLCLLAACEYSPLPEDPCMALVKAKTTIPLGASLATNVDDKLLMPGAVLELQNCRQGHLGEVIPRVGVSALGTGLMGSGGTLRAPWALATLNDALVSFAGVGDNPAVIYSPTANQWGADTGVNGGITTQLRGPFSVTQTRVTGSAGGFLGRVSADVAYSSGYFFVAFREQDAAGFSIFHEQVIDATTGAKLAERVFTPGAGGPLAIMVRVVNGYAVFIRDDNGADITFDAWLISNLDAGPTSTTFATTVTQGDMWDAIANGTLLTVAYSNAARQAAGVDFAPATATATGFALTDATAAAYSVNSSMNWMSDFGASGEMALVSASSGQGVRVQWNIPTSGATRQAANTYAIDAATTTAKAVAGHTTAASAAGTFQVIYTATAGGANQYRMTIATWTAGAATSSVNRHKMLLRSKTFTTGGEYYAVTETPYAVQGTRYVMRIPVGGATALVARAQVNQVPAPGTIFDYQLSAIANQTGQFVAATSVQLRLAGNPGVYQPPAMGAALLSVKTLSAGDTSLGIPREAMQNLFVPGGELSEFDGAIYSNAGFHQFPDDPTIVPSAAPGAMTAASNYTYAIVYRRLDKFGQVWRSAPSISVTTAIGANTSMSLSIPTYVAADTSDVLIEVYRGAANSTTPLQLITSITNDTTVTSITYVDGTGDAVQATGEFLYTTGGGVLVNDPIPGFSSLAVAGNRLFGVSMDEPDAIWPSAPFVPGIGLRFSESTKFYIRDDHGPLTGLAALPNGVVVAFKSDAVYAITGDGPDQAGRGSFRVDFIAIGLGSINPRSIVETSAGCEFLSTSTKAGWYQINAGLNPIYVGGPIERYIGKTIVGAVLIPSKNETRYYTNTNDGGNVRALVHNLVTGLWNVDVSPDDFGDITCATAYSDGAAYGALSPAGVHVDAANTWADLGVSFNTIIASPWAKFADLRGYERIYRARGVGKLDASETGVSMTVALQKNMVETNVVLQTMPSVLDATCGWEMRYSAKFESARWIITATPGLFTAPASLAWTAIVVEYGIRQGLGPISSTRRTA